MEIYGAVCLKRADGRIDAEYYDDDIALLVGERVGAYGSNWIYGGDQGFNESNICIVDSNGNSTSYGGRSGLKDALIQIQKLLNKELPERLAIIG
jgi:hypothetical protein